MVVYDTKSLCSLGLRPNTFEFNESFFIYFALQKYKINQETSNHVRVCVAVRNRDSKKIRLTYFLVFLTVFFFFSRLGAGIKS